MKFLPLTAALTLFASPTAIAQTWSHTGEYNGTYCVTDYYGGRNSSSSTRCGPHNPNVNLRPENIKSSCQIVARTGEYVDTGLKYCPSKFEGLPFEPTVEQIRTWAAQ